MNTIGDWQWMAGGEWLGKMSLLTTRHDLQSNAN